MRKSAEQATVHVGLIVHTHTVCYMSILRMKKRDEVLSIGFEFRRVCSLVYHGTCTFEIVSRQIIATHCPFDLTPNRLGFH